MSSSDPIVVTRDLVKRAAGDIETKLGWAFASGAAASFLLELAKAYHVNIPPILVQELPFVCAIIGGYIKSSSGVTVVTTKDTTTGKVLTTEQHSGPAVVTASVPVIPATDPVKPTAVIPSGLAFLQSRGTDTPPNDPNATEKLN